VKLLQEKGPLQSGLIATYLELDANDCSYNLCRLAENGILLSRRSGKCVFYGLNHEILALISNFFNTKDLQDDKNI